MHSLCISVHEVWLEIIGYFVYFLQVFLADASTAREFSMVALMTKSWYWVYTVIAYHPM